MAGYIRQDTLNEIEDAEVIKAEPLDAEFDALVAAFSAASGHKHSGLTGEGAPITVVGPTQNVSVSANSITPSVDDFMDLGSSVNEFKNLWIDGTANIDVLAADAATVGGVAVTTASNTQTLTNKTIDLTNNTLIATSAELAAAVTDETGTGALVFADSPALAGTPTAPTAAAATNTTQVATTAHVFAERSNAATLTNKTINLTNNTLVATSAQVAAAVTDETGTGSLVFSVSPALTGTPTAPTAVADTNTTQLATTAHVFAERSNTATLTNKTLTSPAINTPTVTGGTITGITDLAVADGGTGASDAATARTNLGLVIGTNVQAADATLTSIAALGTAADRMAYTTGVDTWAETVSTAFGRSLMDDADSTAGRATLGLGTMATQAASGVAITGGSITGITDLAVADGGTGASTAAGALTNLGLTATAAQINTLATIPGTLTGTELGYVDGVTSSIQTQLDAKQPLDAELTALAGLSGTGIVAKTGAGTFAERTITSTGGTITITNAGGVAGNINLESAGGIQAQTPITASGQTIMEWTGIPAGVKRITVSLDGVSAASTGSFRVQLGTSGSYETTGYTGGSTVILGGSGGSANQTAGITFDLVGGDIAGATRHGQIVLNRLSGTETWVAHGTVGLSNTNGTGLLGYSKTLPSAITRIRASWSSADTFDTGSVGVSWET